MFEFLIQMPMENPRLFDIESSIYFFAISSAELIINLSRIFLSVYSLIFTITTQAKVKSYFVMKCIYTDEIRLTPTRNIGTYLAFLQQYKSFSKHVPHRTLTLLHQMYAI